MTKNFKVAILSDTMYANNPDIVANPQDYNQNIGHNLQHARPAGPGIVSEIFIDHGYYSTVFNYYSYWNREELLETLETYSEGYPLLVAFSMTLNTGKVYIDKLTSFVHELKERIPGSVTIVGGIRHYEDFEKFKPFGDLIYFGRSTNLLRKSIHDGLFEEVIGTTFEPKEIRHPNLANLPDSPVVHKFFEQDLWEEHDVGIFETSLGCKFDCTFCNFDFRRMKNPETAEVDRLVEYFHDAKKYGVTHFYTADDTINETDKKIDLLDEATKELDWDVHIGGFARLEMFRNRPDRIDKFSRIGLHSMNFGIETFGEEAGKLIRKNAKPDEILQTLADLKSANPNFFLFSTFIVGLTKDSEENIYKYNDIVLEKKLLDGLHYFPLAIYEDNYMWDWQSHIDKEPEKYGYKIISNMSLESSSVGSPRNIWKNDWIDYHGAKKLRNKLYDHNITKHKLHTQIANWTYTCMKAAKFVTSPTTFPAELYTKFGRTVEQTFHDTPTDRLIYRYIDKKKKYVNEQS